MLCFINYELAQEQNFTKKNNFTYYDESGTQTTQVFTRK